MLFAEISRMGRSTLQVPEMLETCMKRGLNDPEPRLARHGYNAGILPPGRTEEIHKQLLAKGIPA